MLFNLVDDVGEVHNLYSTRQDIASQLWLLLEEWEKDMQEPLWSEFSKQEILARRKLGLPDKRSPDVPYAKLDDRIGKITTRQQFVGLQPARIVFLRG